MERRKLRLAFSIVGFIVALTMLLSACAPATPQIVEKEVIRTVVVEKEVPIEKKVVETVVVEKVITATPEKTTGTLTLQTAFTRGDHYNYLWQASGSQYETLPWIAMGLTWKDYVDPVLWLAKSIDVDPSGTKAKITLYPEAKWHDGKPLTTEDVLFSWELYMGPYIEGKKTNAKQFNIKGGADFEAGKANKIAGVKIISPTEMEVEFETPDGLWAQRGSLTFQIMPKHILDTADRTTLATHPYMDAPIPGNGPFEFVKFELDQYIEAKRVDDWWGNEIFGAAYYDRVIWKQLRIEVAVAPMEAQELDIARVTNTEADRLRQFDYLEVIPIRTYGFGSVYANSERVKMDAIKAFRYAIDQTAFIEAILGANYGRPAATWLAGPEWMQSPNVPVPPYDPDKAKQMLQDANFDFNTEFIYLLRDNAISQTRAQLFQGFLSDIGVKVTLQPVASAALGQTLDEGNWDFSDTGTPGKGVPSPAESCVNWLKNPRKFAATWGDLCDKMYATTSQDEYQKLTWEFQELLWNTHPTVTLYESDSVVIVNKRIAGYEPVGCHGNLLKLRPAK